MSSSCSSSFSENDARSDGPDSFHKDDELNKSSSKLYKNFVVINANARSLSPKMESLADCLYEIDGDVAIVTETWLQDGALVNTTIDLAGEHGLDIFTLNRETIAANGRQYGGVAIASRCSRCAFKPIPIPNPDSFEVLGIVGKVKGIKDKIVVIAVYIPPNYVRSKAESCLDYISDVIAEAKRRHQSAMIVVAGDWNQWPVESVVQDHVDLSEVDHGPTRGDRKLDRFLVNFPRAIAESDVLPPLDDGNGRESDHLVAYFKAKLELPVSKKVSYTYKHFTDEGAARFQQWLAAQNFEDLYQMTEVNQQVDFFLGQLDHAMNMCFDTKTTVRRSSDPPWIDWKVKVLARKRRKIYHREGRSPKWKKLMLKCKDLVRTRAVRYWEHQKRNLLQKDAGRMFFKSVKYFNSKERPPVFDVRSLFEEGTGDQAVSEKLADHFNGISREFDGLSPQDVPSTYSSPIPHLLPEQVATRLRGFKKPKSMVRHDIFPALVGPGATQLAGPLTHIYNTMIATSTWPIKWKEFVTPIPKKSVPASVDDLRNISCTALFSKVFESFVLGWLIEQVGMRENQMGGMKGAGAEHYLVQLWQEVLASLEDPRAASIITSIDYSKAFNRLDFARCLESLAAKGASSELIQMVASFLTSRTMSVKVGQVSSRPRIVLGGVPQGSILGVFLFNATIDCFEADSRDVVTIGTIGGASGRPTGNIPRHDRSLNRRVPLPYDRPGFKPWIQELLHVLKYVDDNIIHEKFCFDGLIIDENGNKVARPFRTENLFRQIARIAMLMGMKVNSAKTLLMCISDARTYKAAAFIEDESGNRVDSVDQMKILGINFSSRPDMSAQVEAICRKFRGRIWTLRHLYHSGFSEAELLTVYKATILPCHDYCSNVFHSSLTLSQSITLERLQAKALKAIYGYDPSYRELMEKASLTTLRARREARELAFANKCLTSDRFSRWFPRRQEVRNTRLTDQFVEEFARCNRYYNSPLFSMRRRLNLVFRSGGAREDGVGEG